MQLKKKMKTATVLDKFKARCCACGNQLDGMISETFSPTVSSLAHAVLHQIAIIDEMETCLIDTVAAYLNQPYPDDATPLYLKLPIAVAEACGLNPDITYRVKKYIYGLPDAGMAYYLAYKEHLLQHGYSPTASDPCLFDKALGEVVDWYRSKGLTPKVLRTDAEGILTMGEVAAYIKREKLQPEVSVPYAHYQNFVERYIQTAKALYHFIDCRNHPPISKCGHRSPHQVITGSPTNLQKTFQFAFGDLVSVNVPDELRGWKFEVRHDIGIYVGQPDHSVDGGLVHFPYSGAESVRTGLSLLTISDQAYQRYFSRRTDTRDAARSPWKDLENIVGDHMNLKRGV